MTLLSFRSVLTLTALVVGLPFFTSAQISSITTFTNKEGSTLEAEIIDVTPDWKSMKIKTDRGEFVIKPIKLSLDDQQYIKEWLKEKKQWTEPTLSPSSTGAVATTPAPSSSENKLGIKYIRKFGDKKRIKSTYERLEITPFYFDIEVSNRSREPIEKVDIHYVLVWKDEVKASGSNHYKSSTTTILGKKGSMSIENLEYSRPITFASDSASVETIIREGGFIDGEDEVLGIAIVAMNPEGEIVSEEFVSTKVTRADLDWEKASELPSARTSSSSSYDSVEVELKKGEKTEGPTRLVGQPITIDVEAITPRPNRGGVLVEIGGNDSGVSLYIEDRKLYAKAVTGTAEKFIYTKLPFGEFDAQLKLTEAGLSLSVDGGKPSVLDTVELLTENSDDGISVGGFGESAVTKYNRNSVYNGELKQATIKIGSN